MIAGEMRRAADAAPLGRAAARGGGDRHGMWPRAEPSRKRGGRVTAPVPRALWMAGVALAGCVGLGFLVAPPAVPAAFLCGVALAWFAARRWITLGRVAPIAAAVTDLAEDAGRQELTARTLNDLEANIHMLRSELAKLGPARREGETLLFGAHAINHDTAIVDRVRDALGGTATIFAGDLRVSTNVRGPDGARATGTRLAAGPARDTVLGQGRTYRGEAEIFGETYATVYEPLLSAGEIVGVLYVGVKTGDIAERLRAIRAAASGRDRIAALGRTVDCLRQIVASQQEAARAAMAQRDQADQLRRDNDTMREVMARDQREVVTRLSAVLEQLAAGNLAARLDLASEDYRQIARDYNDAVAALAAALGEVAAASGTMRGSMTEIAAAADDLARRTEQQAADLEETAAALTEITMTVTKTADNTARARAGGQAARGEADAGTGIMLRAEAAMQAIERAASEVAGIVEVIDSIAFQTNLLALNAGVEAARAGEAGKGFAVVAQEVRALAQRAADAARDIRGLIETSNADVRRAVQLVSGAGAALGRIADEVGKVGGEIDEVATATREQAVGLSGVNEAISRMDQVTQNNAAMVEQTTASLQALRQETDRVAELVARFRLPEPQRRAA